LYFLLLYHNDYYKVSFSLYRQSENIKTILRIRPFTEREIEKNEHLMPSSLEVVPPNSVKAKAANLQKPEIFSYDQVADSSTSQEEVFEMIGREMADNCLEGYNGTIFA
jgi:hypothetical protein